MKADHIALVYIYKGVNFAFMNILAIISSKCETVNEYENKLLPDNLFKWSYLRVIYCLAVDGLDKLGQ